MKWGHFPKPDGLHVCPIDDRDRLATGHTLELECECRPKVDYIMTENGRAKVFIHHDGH